MRTLLALAPLSLLLTDGTELRYAPAADTVCTRTFSQTSALSGGDLEVVMDGQEIPAEFLPELAMESTTTLEVTLTDRLVRVADGRPTRLARTVDAVASTFAMSVDMGDGSPAMETELVARSPLVGQAFRFERDGSGDGVWAFADEDAAGGDPAWLAGLVEEVDLRGLLPAESVARGDSWSVPAAQLAALLAPGGDLALAWDGEGAERMAVDEEAPLTGEVELTLRALETSGGREYARVALAGTLEVITRAVGDLEHVPVVDGTMTETTTAAYELDGELRIDPTTGLVHAVELEARTTMTVKTVKDAGQPGPEFESRITLRGDTTFGMQLELGD